MKREAMDQKRLTWFCVDRGSPAGFENLFAGGLIGLGDVFVGPEIGRDVGEAFGAVAVEDKKKKMPEIGNSSRNLFEIGDLIIKLRND